jgi:hypothetical protein
MLNVVSVWQAAEQGTTLDPERWPPLVQWAVLAAVAVSAFGCQAMGPGAGPLGLVWSVAAPAVGGALIWRFDGVRWADIGSWTLPMTGWIVLSLAVIPGSARFLVAFGVALVWLLVFVLWLPPVRWWYRHVLRRQMPGGLGPK